MEMERALQHEILTRLAASYPDSASVETWEFDPAQVSRQLHYLSEHDLVKLGHINKTRALATIDTVDTARITARGLDFLAEDGGLTAVLAPTIWVKFDADTIEAISRVIQTSKLPAEKKKQFIDQLRSLPGDAIKHLTTKLVDLAIEHSAEALPLIQRGLESLQQ